MTDANDRHPALIHQKNIKTTKMKNALPDPASNKKQHQQPLPSSTRAGEGSLPAQPCQAARSTSDGRTQMKTSFIGFARVARVEGNNLDVQEERIREYAEASGYPLTKVHRIVENAADPSARPVFWRAVKEVMESANELAGILFYAIDRVARNVEDIERLYGLAREHGLAIEFTVPQELEALSNGEARAEKAIELSPRVSRTVHGLALRAQLGLFVGRTPYAYEIIGQGSTRYAETDPAQARVVERAFELIDTRACLPGELEDTLFAEGLIHTQKKPRFTKQQLQSMLRDRAYLGEVNFGGRTYEGSQEQIIGEDVFDRVQAILDRAGWRR